MGKSSSENTLVIFTADHGDMAGDHGMIWKSTDAFYEELVRMPLLISWPAELEPGTDSRCASLADIMPTILDAAGVSPERPVQGRSRLGVDRGSHPGFSVTQRFSQHDPCTRHVAAADRISIMIRTPEAKLARYHDGNEELFDLVRDSLGRVNLAKDPSASERRRPPLGLLVAWMHETRHPQVKVYEALPLV